MFMCDLWFLSLRQQQSFFSSLTQEFDKLFNTQLSLSLFLSCSYADDNTPYVGKNNVRSVVNSLCKKLPGIKIDCKLIFNAHIDKICKKTGQKVNALSRVMPLANITKQYTF